MPGFNWQTVLDTADQYPLQLKIKGDTTIWDPREKPVWITSNYSPEEVMQKQAPARIEALRRRFTTVKVEWVTFGELKTLNWTIEKGQAFKIPQEQWWVTKKAKKQKLVAEPEFWTGDQGAQDTSLCRWTTDDEQESESNTEEIAYQKEDQQEEEDQRMLSKLLNALQEKDK
jgi:hypothetical protein